MKKVVLIVIAVLTLGFVGLVIINLAFGSKDVVTQCWEASIPRGDKLESSENVCNLAGYTKDSSGGTNGSIVFAPASKDFTSLEEARAGQPVQGTNVIVGGLQAYRTADSSNPDKPYITYLIFSPKGYTVEGRAALVHVFLLGLVGSYASHDQEITSSVKWK